MTVLNATFRQQLNELGRSKTPCLFVIDFAMQRPMVWPLDTLSPSSLMYDFNGHTNVFGRRPLTTPPPLQWASHPVSAARYQEAFAKVQQGLQYGDSFLCNLTFPSDIALNWPLDYTFQQVQAKYKLWWRDRFLSFSPETFVQIKDNQIHSFPMKGTRSAREEGADQMLLADPKEQAEHATIVDLIRNDLSQVARQVRVAQYRYLDFIPTSREPLWQTSTHIKGQLADDWAAHLGDIVGNLLPAGSISGAPKSKTLDLIQEAEQQDRGYYTGVAGLFDGETLDSGVLIRFIEQQERKKRYWSGGGITAYSKWEEEYRELVQKVYLPINPATNCDPAEYLSAPLAFRTDVATPS